MEFFITESDKSKSFEEQHQEIVQKYGADIPKPSPELSASLIVISHQELNNNSFWRLVESVSQQENISTSKFEVLLVLNNTKQSALNSDSAFKENQDSLKILSAIREAQDTGITLPDLLIKHSIANLSMHEVGIMTKAINARVNIIGIDASSVDRSLIKSEKSNPRGIARNIGGHLASERLGSKSGTLIDFIDGDCYLSKDYFADVVSTSEKYPGQTVVKPVVSVNPDLPKEIEVAKYSSEQKLFSVVKYLKSSLYNTRLRFLKHPAISGQQIAIPPQVFKDVGGYVTDEHQEDWEFATKIDRVSSISKAPVLQHAKVFLSDRKRPGAVDGYSDGSQKTASLQELVSSQEVSRVNKTVLQILEKDQSLASDPEYRSNRRELFDQYNEMRIGLLKEFNDVIEKGLVAYGSTIDKMNTISRAFLGKSKFSEALNSTLSDGQLDFLGANPVLYDCLMGLIELSKKQSVVNSIGVELSSDRLKNCLSLMEKILPEYFIEPPSAEPNYKLSLELLKESYVQNVNLSDYIHLAELCFKIRG